MTMGDLAKLMPWVAKIMSDGNLSPDTPIMLSPGLEFQLVAPGSTVTDPKQSPLGNSWSMILYPRK